MPGDVVGFFRKEGRVIPIRASGGGDHNSSVKAPTVKHVIKKPFSGSVKPRFAPAALSTALAVGEGAASGISLRHGLKTAALIHSAGIGVEVGSTALAASSFAGKGNARERAKGFAKLETFNQLAGWGTYGALALSHAASRDRVISGLKKVVSLGRKALSRGV